MSLRYQKRVNLGNGLGLNFSKTGLSTSYRTKYGSIGSRGFSIRTGIPGLSFRSYFGKSRKPEEQLIGLVVMLFAVGFILAAILIWNLFRLLVWGVSETGRSLKRKRRDKAVLNMALTNRDPKVTFHQVPVDAIRAMKGRALIKELLVAPEEEAEAGQYIASLGSNENLINIASPFQGKIIFVKSAGEKVKEGDFLFIVNSN
jgi:biotin carboxyl carrier protein